MKYNDLMDLHYLNIWDEEEVTKKIELPVDKKSNFCEHLWLDYTGLNEVYQYCKYCGVKANDS